MCSRNDNSGEAACATGCASSTRKWRSGTRAPSQLREELPDALPDLLAAGEPAPAAAEDADQAITLVDGNEIVLAGGADAVHQERLYVPLQLQGIEARDLLPGGERDRPGARAAAIAARCTARSAPRQEASRARTAGAPG